jgi:hypothetical protein
VDQQYFQRTPGKSEYNDSGASFVSLVSHSHSLKPELCYLIFSEPDLVSEIQQRREGLWMADSTGAATFAKAKAIQSQKFSLEKSRSVHFSLPRRIL